MSATVIRFPPHMAAVVADRAHQHEDAVQDAVVQVAARLSELARLEPRKWPNLLGQIMAAVIEANERKPPRERRRKPSANIFAVPNLGDGPDEPEVDEPVCFGEPSP